MASVPFDASGPRFSAAMVEHLPDAARRFLTHAISNGTPLWSSVELTMHGSIKIGSWRRFRATETLTPPHEFVWRATARVAGLPVSGYDRYTGTCGEMRWQLFGRIPVMSGVGSDITRSAAGRLAGEAISFVPTAFRGADWAADSDPDSCVSIWRIDGQDEHVEVRVDVDVEGRPRRFSLPRWGKPQGTQYGLHTFAVSVDEENHFQGVTIPSKFRAAWLPANDQSGNAESSGEFFRATITQAQFT